MPLILENRWEQYIKRLESFESKCDENDALVFNSNFDKITKAENEELYTILLNKHKGVLYSKRPNPQGTTIEKGFSAFKKLDEKNQAKALLNIIQSFGRISSGCDFRLIEGVQKSGATTLSSSISNWKKNYSDVRIIDMSASGIWEKKSGNLLELL